MKLYNYLANKVSFRGSSHISYNVKAYFLCAVKRHQLRSQRGHSVQVYDIPMAKIRKKKNETAIIHFVHFIYKFNNCYTLIVKATVFPYSQAISA